MKVRKADVWPVVRAAFPEYNGQKFAVEVKERLTLHDLHWDGGTRNEYVAVKLASGESSRAKVANAPWSERAEGASVDIPPGIAIVEHSIFCGKDIGIRVYLNPANAAKLLAAPEASTATARERWILSVYGGIVSGYRPEYLRRERVQPSEVEALVARGLLKRNAAGAVQITIEGKNARGNANADRYPEGGLLGLAGTALSGRSRKLRYQVQVWTERGGMIPVFAAGIKEARAKAASAPTWITPDGPNARVYARTGRVVRVVVLDLDTGEAVS